MAKITWLGIDTGADDTLALSSDLPYGSLDTAGEEYAQADGATTVRSLYCSVSAIGTATQIKLALYKYISGSAQYELVAETATIALSGSGIYGANLSSEFAVADDSAAYQIWVRANGTVTLDSVSGSGTVRFMDSETTYANAWPADLSVPTLDYGPFADSILVWGDDAAIASGGPTVSSATIDAAGTSLSVTFSEAVDFGAGGNAGFTVSTGQTIAYSFGAGTNTLVFTSTPPIKQGQSLTFAYTQPTDGLEADDDQVDVSTFSGQAVTNNSTVVPGLTTDTLSFYDSNALSISQIGDAISVTASYQEAAAYNFANAREGTDSANTSGGTVTFDFTELDVGDTVSVALDLTDGNGDRQVGVIDNITLVDNNA